MSAQGRFSTCSLKDETRNRSEYNWLVVLKIDVCCDLAVVLQRGLTFILLVDGSTTSQTKILKNRFMNSDMEPTKSSVQPPSSALPICDCFDPVAEKVCLAVRRGYGSRSRLN